MFTVIIGVYEGKRKTIDLKKKSLDKSIEAFMMDIEIYNKPSIQYRVEGFVIFMCNAWELMLKAYILKERVINISILKINPKEQSV